MKRSALVKTIAAACMMALPLTYQACSPAMRRSPAAGESSGKSGGTTTDNPKPTVDISVVNSAAGASENVRLCLDEIYFSGPGSQSQTLSLSASSAPAPSWSYPAANYFPTDMDPAYYASPQFIQDLMQYTQSLMGMTFTMASASNFMKTIPILPAVYTGVDLRLATSCAFGSLSVETASGTIDVSEPLVLHFSGGGNLIHSGALVLDATTIMAALTSARNVAEIRAAVSSVEGKF